MHLLADFCQCVRLRSLRHYFIPSFNLLSVKMTDQAKIEILRIFDMILQSDISIIKECKTLNKVWVECLHRDSDTVNVIQIKKMNLLRNDEYMMNFIENLQMQALSLLYDRFLDLLTLTNQLINRYHMYHAVDKTQLMAFVIKILFTYVSISLTYISLHSVGNKSLYEPRRFLQSNVSGIDISTCKLWYAMLMTNSGDYHLSLRIINKVLSSISPYVLYFTGIDHFNVSDETKERYVDMFRSNDTRVTERARRAWMFDLRILPSDMDMIPVAIQVELIHCDEHYGVLLSPFVCAYFLMFLNYCGLRQYDNRDNALRQLIDAVNNPEQRGAFRWHSYNIAGHCLLSVGEIEQAWDMFMHSYQSTLHDLRVHRLNSVRYYLQCLSNNATHS